MQPTAAVIGILAIVLAPLYQFVLKDALFVSLGVGRVIQPIEDFRYTCHKIHDPSGILESCEDLWLDNEGRVLYAACVDLVSRREWSPAVDRLNLSGRTPNGHFVVLDVDSPGADMAYSAQKLKISGDYQGPAGTRAIDPNGFTVEVLPNNRLRFWTTNIRPPVDPASGSFLDGAKFGCNGTIEAFDLTRGESTLNFVATYGANSDVISTPNRVAATGNGGFIATNDHSYSLGLRRALDPLLGGGSLAFCSAPNNCTIIAHGFVFPNGLARGLDGKIYVPSSITGRISIWTLQNDNTLLQTDEINIGMPMDNISVDINGDLFAAAFPDALTLMKEFRNPIGRPVAATIFKIRKLNGGVWVVQKVLEDREGLTLPTGTTTAVHDVKTGRIFIGGVISGYMTVCEPLPEGV